jgi:hypothetical protein
MGDRWNDREQQKESTQEPLDQRVHDRILRVTSTTRQRGLTSLDARYFPIQKVVIARN